MDAYGDHFNYSSHERNYESYPYASNFEEGRNQGFDQRYYEDERYNEYGQYYDDGGYYEDGMHSYNQQVMCNEECDQWSGQPNYYREEHCYPYTSSFEDSQSSFVEEAHEHYPPDPPQENLQYDNLIALMTQALDQQKEINKMLSSHLAQRGLENANMVEEDGSSDEEVHESHEDQPLEESIETLDGLALADYMIRLCSAPLTDDELEPSLEGTLEGEHLEPRGFDLHEDVVEDEGYGYEDGIHAYSQQIPYGGVYDQEEGPIDSYPRVYDCGVYDHEEGYHNAQWEEQCYSTHFENPLWEGDESLHEELGEPLADELETPRGLVIHEDLFDGACEDLSGEQPCTQELMSDEKDDELRTPRYQNQIVEDWLSVEPWSSVEDPYLFTLPPSKFWSFRPYMDISIEWNSDDPRTPEEKYIWKGSKSIFDVHLKLGGRKFKWDIKIS